MPNFAVIHQAIKPLPRFRYFLILQDGDRHNLGLSKSGNFRGGNGQVSQNASPCQSSRQSAKLLLRYGHFSIFQDGGRRHLGFSKGGNFRDGKG